MKRAPETRSPAPIVRDGAAAYRGHSPAAPLALLSAPELIRAVKAGLPMAEFDALRGALALSAERLAAMLGISRATLHRRREAGHLDAAESDRLVRFARLFATAAGALGSEAAARAWLTAPQLGLGDAVPLEYAETEVGAREVEDLLGRIEFGVYA